MRKVAPYLLAAVLTLTGVLLPAPHSVVAQAEQPQLKRIGPDKIVAGCPTFTLRADGKKFEEGVQILFDGVPLPSSRLGQTGKRVLAEIDASMVAAPGSHTVQVVNPDGMASITLPLDVVAASEDLQMRLGGNSAQEDLGQGFQFLVSGFGFEETSEAVVWGEVEATTTFLSDLELIVAMPVEFTTDPARIPIMIRNRGGVFSDAEIFFIVPAPAEIVFIEPESVEVGTEDFEIDVRGAAFKPDAKLVVNGVPLETEHVRDGRLRAIVPGSMRSMPGLLTVRVEQDGIQSADSTIIVAPSEDPFIFTVSPTLIRIGEKKPTLEISGANLSNDILAFIDGQEARVKSSTRRHASVLVPAALLESPGSHSVELRTEEGVVSNSVSFEVVSDVSVTTLAGDSRQGFNEGCVSGDDAHLRRPRRIALGPDGLLYVTDQHNHSIRTINPDTGEVCTIAGTGVSGYHDSGNSAGEPPAFSYPNGITFDAGGTLYVTENGNNVVRRLRGIGGTLIVDTLTGQNVRVINPERQEKLNATKIGIDGFRDGDSTDAAFRLPDDIIAAPDGSLYVADPNNHSIRRITNVEGDVRVETIAGNGVPGYADGTSLAARFNTPMALALSLDGNFLFVADMNNRRIRRIDLVNKQVDTLSGSGEAQTIDGPATEAAFLRPIGLALDSDGTLYVAELEGNIIRRVDSAGGVTTLAGDPEVERFRDGDGLRATFNLPRGLAIDRVRGILYVADYENFRIRSIALR